ncbi:MAG: hypothetical protein ACP5LV_05905, partial [Thermoplasmata archaeon]
MIITTASTTHIKESVGLFWIFVLTSSTVPLKFPNISPVTFTMRPVLASTYITYPVLFISIVLNDPAGTFIFTPIVICAPDISGGALPVLRIDKSLGETAGNGDGLLNEA